MNIIIMGAQGTGKGTIAGILKEELNIPHISTGDIFRKHKQEGTAIGKLVIEYADKGKLVPDEVTNEMIKLRINEPDCKNGFILDGYPRNTAQAEELDKMLEEKNEKVDYAINLTLEMEEIMSRITNRRICSNPECKEIYNLVSKPTKVPGICDKCGSEIIQRVDDSDSEAIKKRLDTYFSQTAPLVDFYDKKRVMYNVESNKPPKELAEGIMKFLK